MRDARTGLGSTPLHMAATNPDVNATSMGGRTPVAMARKSRADDVVGLISLWTLKGCKMKIIHMIQTKPGRKLAGPDRLKVSKEMPEVKNRVEEIVRLLKELG